MEDKSEKYTLPVNMLRYSREEMDAAKEQTRLNKNEKIIDELIETFEEEIGKKLTRYEQDALLRIVDRLTPVGEDEKYLVNFVPFWYAWEVYQAEKEASLEKFKKNFGKKL